MYSMYVAYGGSLMYSMYVAYGGSLMYSMYVAYGGSLMYSMYTFVWLNFVLTHRTTVHLTIQQQMLQYSTKYW